MTDPSKLQQASSRLTKAKKLTSALPQLTGALAGEGEEEESEEEEKEEDAEGEIQSSVTISTLLSKLDSVRVSECTESVFVP